MEKIDEKIKSQLQRTFKILKDKNILKNLGNIEMATPSVIGIINLDGTVEGIYCHWDGHVPSNGKTLLEYYNDEDRIRKLISGGSLSYLAKNIDPIGEHSFEKPEKDVCVYYHRDRGEDLQIYKGGLSIEAFLKWKISKDYNYFYDVANKEWRLYLGKGYITLENVIKFEEEDNE